jgi:hypothetical protein
MRTLKLTILGLAAYGGYTLWNQYGTRLIGRANANGSGTDHRVYGRSELTVTEWAVGSDNPVTQATAILADSDARTDLTRETPGIEHRRSEDTVEP